MSRSLYTENQLHPTSLHSIHRHQNSAGNHSTANPIEVNSGEPKHTGIKIILGGVFLLLTKRALHTFSSDTWDRILPTVGMDSAPFPLHRLLGCFLSLLNLLRFASILPSPRHRNSFRVARLWMESSDSTELHCKCFSQQFKSCSLQSTVFLRTVRIVAHYLQLKSKERMFASLFGSPVAGHNFPLNYLHHRIVGRGTGPSLYISMNRSLPIQ
ncbi:hypothetical protein H671_6g15336 [Cricetulus griseus]|nr:hypothetical protein H671_6g15336 [Cricetulus griseus]